MRYARSSVRLSSTSPGELLRGLRASPQMRSERPAAFCARFERAVPVEGAVDGRQMGEGRRLGEELEGQAVAGIVGVEQIAGEAPAACGGRRPPIRR